MNDRSAQFDFSREIVKKFVESEWTKDRKVSSVGNKIKKDNRDFPL